MKSLDFKGKWEESVKNKIKIESQSRHALVGRKYG